MWLHNANDKFVQFFCYAMANHTIIRGRHRLHSITSYYDIVLTKLQFCKGELRNFNSCPQARTHKKSIYMFTSPRKRSKHDLFSRGTVWRFVAGLCVWCTSTRIQEEAWYCMHLCRVSCQFDHSGHVQFAMLIRLLALRFVTTTILTSQIPIGNEIVSKWIQKRTRNCNCNRLQNFICSLGLPLSAVTSNIRENKNVYRHQSPPFF